MHAGHLIEIATQLSFHNAQVVRNTPAEIVNSEEFWTLSKDKLEHWKKTLHLFHEDLTLATPDHNSWTAISCVVEEILCSEFFVRVASAAFVMKDEMFQFAVNGPIARSVFLFHLEARMRALELIEMGLENNIPEAHALNDLRQRLESWCDLLLGFFPAEIAREFSIDSKRNKEFTKDIEEETEHSKRNVIRLLQISIREYGRKLLDNPAANPTLNRQIADLFGFIDTDRLSSDKPFAAHSINDLTNEAERYIDDYLTIK